MRQILCFCPKIPMIMLWPLSWGIDWCIRRLIWKLLIIQNLNWHWCYICSSFSNNHCRSYGVHRAFCQVRKEKQKLLRGWEFQVISSGLSFWSLRLCKTILKAEKWRFRCNLLKPPPSYRTIVHLKGVVQHQLLLVFLSILQSDKICKSKSW